MIPSINHSKLRTVNSSLSMSPFLFVSLLLFVVVASFAYGLVKGFKQQALATVISDDPSREPVSSDSYTEMRLASGLLINPIGSKAGVSGAATKLVHFVSNRPIENIAKEQSIIWSKKDIRIEKKIGQKRAVVIGVGKDPSERYSLVAWVVPPTLRRASFHGYPVEGTIAEASSQAYEGELAESVLARMKISPMAGGKLGAFFSSRDLGRVTHSGSIVQPGSLEESELYFVDMLKSLGWQREDNKLQQSVVRQLKYVKGSESITLLFSSMDMGELLPEVGVARGVSLSKVEKNTLITVIIELIE